MGTAVTVRWVSHGLRGASRQQVVDINTRDAVHLSENSCTDFPQHYSSQHCTDHLDQRFLNCASSRRKTKQEK